MTQRGLSARPNSDRMLTLLVVGAAALLIASPALAGTTGGTMPWDGPLDQVAQSLSGPVAKAVGIIAIVLTGSGHRTGTDIR